MHLRSVKEASCGLVTDARRCCHLAQKADEAAVAAIDNFFEQVYRYTVRKALDVSLAAAARACVEEHSGTAGLAQLFFNVRHIPVSEAVVVSDCAAPHYAQLPLR